MYLIKLPFEMFQYGMRPILMAAWHGHTDAVQMLINYGASVNTINKVRIRFQNSNFIYSKCTHLFDYIPKGTTSAGLTVPAFSKSIDHHSSFQKGFVYVWHLF